MRTGIFDILGLASEKEYSKVWTCGGISPAAMGSTLAREMLLLWPWRESLYASEALPVMLTIALPVCMSSLVH